MVFQGTPRTTRVIYGSVLNDGAIVLTLQGIEKKPPSHLILSQKRPRNKVKQSWAISQAGCQQEVSVGPI